MDDFIKVPSEIREELKKEFLNKGLNWLQDELKKHDPIYFETVDVNNQQRLLRALEVCVYKELFDHFEGNTSLSEAIEKIKQHTRNYAKRQLTWFKNQDDFEMFLPEDSKKIKAYIDVIRQND